jgi:hypothetical protein
MGIVAVILTRLYVVPRKHCVMLEVGFEARFQVLTAGLAAIHVGVKKA